MKPAKARCGSWPSSFVSAGDTARRSGRSSCAAGTSNGPQQRHGPVGRVTPQVQQQLRSAVGQQPDVTLAELRQRIQQNTGVELGRSWLWVWLRRLITPLKKSLRAQEQESAANLWRRHTWWELIR